MTYYTVVTFETPHNEGKLGAWFDQFGFNSMREAKSELALTHAKKGHKKIIKSDGSTESLIAARDALPPPKGCQTIADNRQRWLEALRGGEYAQGRNLLCDERWNEDSVAIKRSYCCLGVACMILGVKEEKIDGAITYDNNHTAAAPPAVVEGLGLYSHLGDHRWLGASLTTINDSGASFTEIANLLEKGEYWK